MHDHRLAVALLTAACLSAGASGVFVSSSGAATQVTAPPQPSPVEEWEKWRAEENAAWSTKQFAILKIDDAVYLNDGQSAWLTTKKQKALQYAWTLDALSAPSGLRVTYHAPKAEVFHDGKSETFTMEETRVVAVSPGIDVRFQLAQVTPGVNGLRVMVYNQANPLARDFKGLDHFPYNPAAVVSATFVAAAKPEGVDFQTSRGWYKRFYKMGVASFTLEGKSVRLPMYAETAEAKDVKSLSAFYLDDLAGKETYGVGRYVDVEVKGLPSSFTIDFNRAYNPNCARSPHYNCPVATDKIPLALRAAETLISFNERRSRSNRRRCVWNGSPSPRLVRRA